MYVKIYVQRSQVYFAKTPNAEDILLYNILQQDQILTVENETLVNDKQTSIILLSWENSFTFLIHVGSTFQYCLKFFVQMFTMLNFYCIPLVFSFYFYYSTKKLKKIFTYRTYLYFMNYCQIFFFVIASDACSMHKKYSGTQNIGYNPFSNLFLVNETYLQIIISAHRRLIVLFDDLQIAAELNFDIISIFSFHVKLELIF